MQAPQLGGVQNVKQQTPEVGGRVIEQISTTTLAIQLLPREPQFNGNDCSAAASRSATEAIRQVSQSASQAIQQATQSASQAIQQATISATNAIRDAQNIASQSVAQASRSSSSISSSASSAMLSVQSSADNAIASARNEARSLMSQASAAIAAATGKNAAAASCILSQVARPTACSENNGNNNIVSSSLVGISPTHAALAIVGSIFASTLLSFALFFFFRRHRKKAAAKKRALMQQTRRASWRSSSFDSGKGMTTITTTTVERIPPVFETMVPRSSVEQQTSSFSTMERRHKNMKSPQVTLSLFPKTPTPTAFEPPAQPNIKQTDVSWDPRAPQRVPKLGNWLKIQRPVSPFGSIKLPVDDEQRDRPLGGQLKSPLYRGPAPTTRPREREDSTSRNLGPTTSHPTSQIDLIDTPSVVYPTTPNPVSTASRNAVTRLQDRGRSKTRNQPGRRRSIPDFIESETKERYKEDKAAVWTSDIDGVSGLNNEPIRSRGRAPSLSSRREEQGRRGRSQDRRQGVRPVGATLGVYDATRGGAPITATNLAILKTTEVQLMDGDRKGFKEEVTTPDTVVARSARLGTAVRGRMLVPSVIDERRRKGSGSGSRLRVSEEV